MGAGSFVVLVNPNLETDMKKTNWMLWTVQILLAALFLFAGAMKLIAPMEELAREAGLPGPFLKFIGIAEVLGGLGLALPGLVRIPPVLTSLAAAGLVIIMIGAVALTVARGPAPTAVVPFVVGVLAALVAYGRWRIVPLGGLR